MRFVEKKVHEIPELNILIKSGEFLKLEIHSFNIFIQK